MIPSQGSEVFGEKLFILHLSSSTNSANSKKCPPLPAVNPSLHSVKYFIHKPQCITFWRILNSLLEEFRDHELQERHRKLLPLTSHLWWTMRKHEVCFHIATHDHVSNVQNVSKPVQLQMESKVFKSLPNEKVPELTYDSCSLHSPYLQSWQSTCITEEPEGKEKVTSFECVDVKLRILIG